MTVPQKKVLKGDQRKTSILEVPKRRATYVTVNFNRESPNFPGVGGYLNPHRILMSAKGSIDLKFMTMCIPHNMAAILWLYISSIKPWGRMSNGCHHGVRGLGCPMVKQPRNA